MTLFGIINIPLVISGISILLFFIWLGKYADAVEKNLDLGSFYLNKIRHGFDSRLLRHQNDSAGRN